MKTGTMKMSPTLRRRNLFASLFAGLGAVLTNRAEAAPVVPDRAKVVYHLCDLDKVNFVLGNIKNHFDGMGGDDRVGRARPCAQRVLFGLGQSRPDQTRRWLRQGWARTDGLRPHDGGTEHHVERSVARLRGGRQRRRRAYR